MSHNLTAILTPTPTPTPTPTSTLTNRKEDYMKKRYAITYTYGDNYDIDIVHVSALCKLFAKIKFALRWRFNAILCIENEEFPLFKFMNPPTPTAPTHIKKFR